MKKIFVLFIIITFLNLKALAGYIEKINLTVTGEIAEPILIVENDEEIIGNFSSINEIPTYKIKIRNYNQEKISELAFNLKIQINSNVEFELIDESADKVLLDSPQNTYNIFIDKDKLFENTYILKLKPEQNKFNGKLDIKIDAKYFKFNLNAFSVDFDSRDLEYEIIIISEENKKYTNKDVTVKINLNKQVKEISGFENLENNTCLQKTYTENVEENIRLEDYFGNVKNINIQIKNIDKNQPQIENIEEGKIYAKGQKLIYKDNIGIKNISIENISERKKFTISFDDENKVIDKDVQIQENDTLNPYYLDKAGEYKITVTDFAGNITVRHISVK